MEPTHATPEAQAGGSSLIHNNPAFEHTSSSSINRHPHLSAQPLVSVMSSSSAFTSTGAGDMSVTSSVAMGAGDEYAFYRSWLHDQKDKDPELAQQWVQWEAQGLISPRCDNASKQQPWNAAASTHTSSRAAAVSNSTSTSHHLSSGLSAAAAVVQRSSLYLPASLPAAAAGGAAKQHLSLGVRRASQELLRPHNGGGGGRSSSDAAVMPATGREQQGQLASEAPHSLKVSKGSGATTSSSSSTNNSSGSPTVRKGEFSRSHLKAVRKLFPIRTPAPKPSTQLQGQYQQLDIIGKGAFGCAYKARHLPTGRLVCIKTLEAPGGGGGNNNNNNSNKSEELARQMREVAVLAALAVHPNIIRYHECFADSGKLQLVMQWADGGDLDSLIQRHVKSRTYMPEDTVLGYFVQLVAALAHVHAVGIMHRDVKSSNCFLTTQGLLLLGDFGISKVIDCPGATSSNSGSGGKTAGGTSSAMTSTSGVSHQATPTSVSRGVFAHSFVGTPQYLAPEMVLCEGYGFKADMWAAGCVLYEMAALKPAFRAKHISIIYHLIRRGKLSPLPAMYSKELQALLRRMMARDPAERPSCAELMQDDLLRPHFARYYTLMRQLNLELPTMPLTPDHYAAYGSSSGSLRTAALLSSGSYIGGPSSCRTSMDEWGWNRAAANRQKGSRESSEFKRPLASAHLQQQPLQSAPSSADAAAAAIHPGQRLLLHNSSSQRTPAVSAGPNTPLSQLQQGARSSSVKTMQEAIQSHLLLVQADNVRRRRSVDSRSSRTSSEGYNRRSTDEAAVHAATAATAASGPGGGMVPNQSHAAASRWLSGMSRSNLSNCSSASRALTSLGSGAAADISSSEGEPSSDGSILVAVPPIAAAVAAAVGAVDGPATTGAPSTAAAMPTSAAVTAAIAANKQRSLSRPPPVRIDVLTDSPRAHAGIPAAQPSTSTTTTGATTSSLPSTTSRTTGSGGSGSGGTNSQPTDTPAGIFQQAEVVDVEAVWLSEQQEHMQQQQQLSVPSPHMSCKHRCKVFGKLHQSLAALFGGRTPAQRQSRLGVSELQATGYPELTFHKKHSKTRGRHTSGRSSSSSKSDSGDGAIRSPEQAAAAAAGGADDSLYTRSWSDLLRDAGINPGINHGADAELLQKAGDLWEGASRSSSQRSSLEQSQQQKQGAATEASGSQQSGGVLSLLRRSIDKGPKSGGSSNRSTRSNRSSLDKAATGTASTPSSSPNTRLRGGGSVELCASSAVSGRQGSTASLSSWFGRGSVEHLPSAASSANTSPTSPAVAVTPSTQTPQPQQMQQAHHEAATPPPKGPEEPHEAMPVGPNAAVAATGALLLPQQLHQLRHLAAAFGAGPGLLSGGGLNSLSTITEGSESSRMASRRGSETPAAISSPSVQSSSCRSSAEKSPKSAAAASAAAAALKHQSPLARPGGNATSNVPSSCLSPVQEGSVAVACGEGEDECVDSETGAAAVADSSAASDAMYREQLVMLAAVQQLKAMLRPPGLRIAHQQHPSFDVAL